MPWAKKITEVLQRLPSLKKTDTNQANYLVVGCDIFGDYKNYNYFINPEKFLDFFHENRKLSLDKFTGHNYFYELIDDRIKRGYLDIDIKNTINIDIDNIISNVIHNAIQIFSEDFNINCDPEDIRVYTSNGSNLYSIHIVFDIGFENMDDM